MEFLNNFNCQNFRRKINNEGKIITYAKYKNYSRETESRFNYLKNKEEPYSYSTEFFMIMYEREIIESSARQVYLFFKFIPFYRVFMLRVCLNNLV